MSTIDLLFLIAALLGLAALLIFDKISRAIIWETLRHPFTSSRIEVKDGQVRISHPASTPAKQPNHPAGAS